MFKRKSIVLSDVEKGTSKKAVLSLEENENGVAGALRLYNFSQELSGISSLGFYIGQKVYKAGLTFKSHMLYEFFIAIKEIPSKFSCAVVNFQNAIANPLLYGSSEGSDENIYGSIISEISSDNSLKNTESVLNKYEVDFEENEKEEIEKEIDKSMCDCKNDCINCVYKKFFYENQISAKSADNVECAREKVCEIANCSLQEDDLKQINDEQTVKEISEEENEAIFFNKLKPQIDKLFEKNPIESNLQNLIPNSKWVKVEYEDEGDFYVFGLLYDELGNVKYVCYGVPAVSDEEVPAELSGYPVWLPLDKENENGFGYWMTYQDAVTGQPIRAVLD